MPCKFVNNSVSSLTGLKKMAEDFFPYAEKQMGFDQPVSVVFQSDSDNAQNMLGKTAHYDPLEMAITLFTDNRHPKDILRSLSHELVHHTQNCRGDFDHEMDTSPGYAQKDDHLRDMEREAYEQGNLVFRDWEDLFKQRIVQENMGNKTKITKEQLVEIIKAQMGGELLTEALPALIPALMAGEFALEAVPRIWSAAFGKPETVIDTKGRKLLPIPKHGEQYEGTPITRRSEWEDYKIQIQQELAKAQEEADWIKSEEGAEDLAGVTGQAPPPTATEPAPSAGGCPDGYGRAPDGNCYPSDYLEALYEPILESLKGKNLSGITEEEIATIIQEELSAAIDEGIIKGVGKGLSWIGKRLAGGGSKAAPKVAKRGATGKPRPKRKTKRKTKQKTKRKTKPEVKPKVEPTGTRGQRNMDKYMDDYAQGKLSKNDMTKLQKQMDKLPQNSPVVTRWNKLENMKPGTPKHASAAREFGRFAEQRGIGAPWLRRAPGARTAIKVAVGTGGGLGLAYGGHKAYQAHGVGKAQSKAAEDWAEKHGGPLGPEESSRPCGPGEVYDASRPEGSRCVVPGQRSQEQGAPAPGPPPAPTPGPSAPLPAPSPRGKPPAPAPTAPKKDTDIPAPTPAAAPFPGMPSCKGGIVVIRGGQPVCWHTEDPLYNVQEQIIDEADKVAPPQLGATATAPAVAMGNPPIEAPEPEEAEEEPVPLPIIPPAAVPAGAPIAERLQFEDVKDFQDQIFEERFSKLIKAIAKK